MKSRKLMNPDGTTNKIVVQHDNGAFSSYTTKQAAEMINELSSQLWVGIPTSREFREERFGEYK